MKIGKRTCQNKTQEEINMSSVSSIKKVEGLQELAGKIILFLGEAEEATKKLKMSNEVIAVPVFDKITNGLISVANSGSDLSANTADEMVKLATTWGEREGFGPKAAEAFEDCKTSVKAIHGVTFKEALVDESDGLHENVTAETIEAFTKSLTEYIQVKNQFIYGVASVNDENNTIDTAEIFQSIGSGMEKYTNGIIDVLDAHKSEISKFGVNLDEATSAAKLSAANIRTEGETTAKRIIGEAAFK